MQSKHPLAPTRWTLLLLAVSVFASAVMAGSKPTVARDLEVLFLGDQGHHQPLARFKQLRSAMAPRGIELTYTQDMRQINSETLSNYDALIVYANIDRIDEGPAQALLEYVKGGKGFVPLHCASYCFRNNDEVVALIGAQFQRHGTGVFHTRVAEVDHPILKGYGGFESWDETYVHHLHNEEGRTVLEYRDDQEGSEPWTWVKEYGDGRVFYTAWGHDERTWGDPGFQNLVERGVRWAAKDDPALAGAYQADRPFVALEMTEPRTDVKPFEYEDVGAKIPNYTPSSRWGTQGEPMRMMQRPIEPAESMKHYVVPKGFHLELFASDPELGGKPIFMTWDERGRMWVCETMDYPNELKPEGEGRDRIRICEDTDQDGKADKFTIFADKLSIPTTLAFSRGSVIVQNGTQTLRLTDTDGDDVADEREVMFSGWALGDTHGGVSNFQYGHDNWIWAMQGYNQSAPRINGEATQRFGQGFFRFKPDGSAIEFIRSTNNNTWGLGISEEGIIFGSTANANPSVYMPIANRYYEAVRGWAPSTLGTIADTFKFKPITDKVRQVDQFGGYTAGAGHSLYTARTYPQQFWNRTAFVNGPTGHLVGTFVLKPDGSDFHSTSPMNLVASDDEWAAPIMAEVGPDGNVWILDWYNFIVQHNPTPQGFKTGRGNAYESDLRDKRHGRVYRLVYDEGETTPTLDLTKMQPTEIVQVLRSPNMLWRRHAQRLLVESGDQSVVDDLVAVLQEPKVDAIGLDVGAIHALWTLHGLDAIQPGSGKAFKAVVAALQHPSAGVRRNALQVLPIAAESTAAILAANSVSDPDYQVRLAALLALADRPSAEGVGAQVVGAITAPESSNDRWLPEAATAAAAQHSVAFFSSLSADEEPNAALLKTATIVAEHVARTADGEAVEALLVALPGQPAEVASAVMQGLADGWPSDRELKLSEKTEQALVDSFEKLSIGTRGQLIRLAGIWGSTKFESFASEIIDSMMTKIKDEDTSTDERVTAARELIEFRPTDSQTTEKLLDQISPQTPPELAIGWLNALRGSQIDSLGEELVVRVPEFTPGQRTAAIGVMMLRPEWTRSLIDAVEKRVVQLSELSLEQQRNLTRHPDRRIAAKVSQLIERGGGLPSADRQEVIEKYVSATTAKGNITEGQQVFEKNCANCHIYGKLGKQIGPDLTGMAVHPREELLGHILDPNASVEGNFRVYSVATLDGLVFNGLLASETKTSIELFNSDGEKQVVLRDDIDELRASPQSLMPVGFEKEISVEQMTSLLAFLTQRGKYIPLDITKAATAPSDRGMFISADAEIERLVFKEWGVMQFKGVPFNVIDPKDGTVANAIELFGPLGAQSRSKPRSASLICGGPVKQIHLLGGIAGWSFPYSSDKTVSMIVRLHYEDGETEDHPLVNGEHFADYIRHVDVPKSEHVPDVLRGPQQMRYLSVQPEREAPLEKIEFVKGRDQTAPIIMAVTIESPEGEGEGEAEGEGEQK